MVKIRTISERKLHAVVAKYIGRFPYFTLVSDQLSTVKLWFNCDLSTVTKSSF